MIFIAIMFISIFTYYLLAIVYRRGDELLKIFPKRYQINGIKSFSGKDWSSDKLKSFASSEA
jgi:hypothetical protein